MHLGKRLFGAQPLFGISSLVSVDNDHMFGGWRGAHGRELGLQDSFNGGYRNKQARRTIGDGGYSPSSQCCGVSQDHVTGRSWPRLSLLSTFNLTLIRGLKEDPNE